MRLTEIAPLMSFTALEGVEFFGQRLLADLHSFSHFE
jgi:hypothetical protein